jgi:hypothetical protein
MKRIYIAGKLTDITANYIQNMHEMIKVAEEVRSSGYSVFIPCLDILSGLVIGGMGYNDFFNNNIEWLKVSDAMYLTSGWEKSEGTRKEIQIANEHEIPIFIDIRCLNSYFEGLKILEQAKENCKYCKESKIEDVKRMKVELPDEYDMHTADVDDDDQFN